MPTKGIPTPGRLDWGNPLNDHLAQISDPLTGGINTAPLSNPTADDEGYTYLDIATQKLYRLNSSSSYDEVLATSLPLAAILR